MMNILNRHNGLYILVAMCAAAYFAIVLFLSIYSTLDYWLLLPVFFAAFLFVLLLIEDHLNDFKITRKTRISKTKLITYFFLFFGILLLGNVIYWCAYYPGGFNLDALGQWDQVHGYMHYNDWHPIITTLFYWAITRIVDNFAFCIGVQIVLISFSISCLLSTLLEKGVSLTILIVLSIFVALNPAITLNNICLYKDVLFSIVVVWITIYAINIVDSGGEWFDSVFNCIKLLILCSLTILIRHNGLFFVIPLLVISACIYKKRMLKVLCVLSLSVLVVGVVKGPIFSYFNVDKHSNFTGEIVGLPMAAIVNEYLVDGNQAPNEIEGFLTELASYDEWENYYILGEWDSCKWEFGGIELFKDKHIGEFLDLSIKAFSANKNAVYSSVRENTRVVWQAVGSSYWDTWVYIEDNDYGIEYNGVSSIRKMIETYVYKSTNSINSMFSWNIGFQNVVLIVVALIVVAKRKADRLMLILPTVGYNLLTMLLLCGPSHRYFYYTTIIFLPITLYSGLKDKENIEMSK